MKAAPEKVYSMILDPNQISQCMPELQKLDVKSPNDFTAVIKAGVSFIKGDFTLHFLAVEKTPNSHAKLTAHGTGIGSTVDMETYMESCKDRGGWDVDEVVSRRQDWWKNCFGGAEVASGTGGEDHQRPLRLSTGQARSCLIS